MEENIFETDIIPDEETVDEIPAAENELIQREQEPQNPVDEETEFQQVNVHKKGKKITGWIAAVSAAVCLVAVSGGVAVLCMNGYWANRMNAVQKEMQQKISALEKQISMQRPNVQIQLPEGAMTPGQVYATNVDAVVAISNESLRTNIYGQSSKTASSGSGFLISADGYVVTNYHVVKGATTLRVITSEKEYEAELIGYDSANDIAVLKVEGTDLPFVKLGSSDALHVGDQVFAIGNPLGELTSTLTVGYVSAKDRMISTDGSYINMLQTDASINSGNSGGPLFNAYGEVIGITTAKYSGTSNSGATIEGIGFAIPIDDVSSMIRDLVTRGYISGAYLGVMVRDMDPAVCETYGLPMGVLVDEATEGNCAQKAGVQAKDIIVRLGTYETKNLSDLTKALREYEPGDTITITVFRSGAEKVLDITLDEKPKQMPDQQEQIQQTEPADNNIEDWFNGIFPGFGW